MEFAHEGDSSDLRIVLLGVCGDGKSSIGNKILGRRAFGESRTRESEIQRGTYEYRIISIIDTPGFFSTHLTDEELWKQMRKSLDLSHPGPHVFLLVVNLENFREEQRNVVEEIQEIFGAQAFKFTMVLFTGRERMSSREWMVFIHSRRFLDLICNFRGEYHVINSKNEIYQCDITELLQKIDEFVKQNNGQHYNNQVFSVPRMKSIRIKRNQAEELKLQKIIQNQAKVSLETFTTHSEKRETMRDPQKQEEEHSYRARIEQTKSESFETEERTMKLVTEEEHLYSLVRETKISTNTYVNVDCFKNSIDRFDDFNRQTRDKNAFWIREQSWAMNHRKNYQAVPEEDSELRMVLVGKTGVGKSATGNTILGEEIFHEEMVSASVTEKCQKHKKIAQSRIISVIDTPGLFDTNITQENLKKEIKKCIFMSVPGPHVFLLVIRLDARFTDEEKNTVKWIQEHFGEYAQRYTMVLFTRGDQLETSIEKFLKKSKEIKELVDQCEGRYHVFNNKEKSPAQVNELIEKIEIMVMKNGGEHYTNEMYKEAQRQIMMKKIEDTALVGVSVAGVGAAVAGGAVLFAATGGAALPAALLVGGVALTGGSSAAKGISNRVKSLRLKKRNPTLRK